jgi:hypothetical protein
MLLDEILPLGLSDVMRLVAIELFPFLGDRVAHSVRVRILFENTLLVIHSPHERYFFILKI